MKPISKLFKGKKADAAAEPKGRKFPKIPKPLLIAGVIVIVIVGAMALLPGGGAGIGGNYATETVARRDITVSVSGTGTIKPIHSGTIVGMVTGDILTDTFAIGDRVEKDQILYTIDDETARTSVEQAELALRQAQLSYDQAVDATKDLTVTSTVAGQVTDIAVKRGDNVNPGTPVATITDNKTMTLKCHFNKEDAQYITAGQAATVTITATGETVPATVKNVSAYTETAAGGALVQSVELSVVNPGGITGGLAATAQVGTYACQSGGTFEFATQTQIVSKGSGTVGTIYVSEGTSVAVGTQLLTLSSTSLDSQIKTAALGVENAKLSLKTARDMLDNYKIKAPISGTVTQKDLNAGDNIGQVGTTTMAVISDLSALTFDMLIDELDIPHVAQGQSVEITVDALPGQTFHGYVDKININGVTANGVTNYPVTVMVDGTGSGLLPGMNVSANIIIEKKSQVLTIPLTAISRGNTVRTLPADAITEKDGTQELDLTRMEERKVTLGVNDDTYVEILDGLTADDMILVEQSGLPGMGMSGEAGDTAADDAATGEAAS